MELERIETINQRLKENYGLFDVTNHPIWRVVWSEDELEKRWVQHTAEGLDLLTPRVEERPKYRQWIQSKYVLERLTVYPDFVNRDTVEKLTYEPVWVFEDNKGNALPPKWQAIYVIIEQIHTQAKKTMGVKYQDPNVVDPKDAKEKQLQDVIELERELFGNETDVGTSLAYKEGISVPRNYERGANNGSSNEN